LFVRQAKRVSEGVTLGDAEFVTKIALRDV
jgi:hypothetical protein